MPTRKCALCLLVKDLQDSHLLPASLYKKTRPPQATNPNRSLITKRGIVQTSRQMKDYLLCKGCEGLFSRNGEQYVMEQVSHQGRFPLLDTLRAVQPTKTAAGFDWYNNTTVPGVNRDKLGYFALSVFWRAAVHRWERLTEEPISIDLGPYQEELRKYLYGEASFPANVVLLSSCVRMLCRKIFFILQAAGENGKTLPIHSRRGD